MLENLTANKKYWILGGIIVLIIICFGFFRCQDGHRKMWGQNNPNVITVTGHGEVQAAPDIAEISFSIRKEAKTVKEAQTAVAEIEKKALDSLKTNDVLEKDIKTVSASFNPKYEYQYTEACTQYRCPGKNVIVGYEAYENINVKVRNTDSTGKIIQDLGALGVSDLFGPNFTIDNEEGLQTEARKQAIDEAKLKAKVLAKDLGIRLGKITSFSEGENYPRPMYDKMMTGANFAESSAPAELPKGENTITSDVTITYEIR